MPEFASRWPDMREWAIARIKEMLVTPLKVSAERIESLDEQIVVSVVPAQMETSVSRNFLVTIECWSGTKTDAHDLCADAVFALESSPRRGPFVKYEGTSGPNEQRDDDGTYYFDATTTITAQRAS